MHFGLQYAIMATYDIYRSHSSGRKTLRGRVSGGWLCQSGQRHGRSLKESGRSDWALFGGIPGGRIGGPVFHHDLRHSPCLNCRIHLERELFARWRESDLWRHDNGEATSFFGEGLAVVSFPCIGKLPWEPCEERCAKRMFLRKN